MISRWLKKRNVIQKSYKINPDILNQPFIDSSVISDLYQLIDPLVLSYHRNMSKKETLTAIFKENDNSSVLSKSCILCEPYLDKLQLTKSTIKCYFTQLLEKSVDHKSWSKMAKAHKPEQMADIDHKPHLGNTPPNYIKALESDIKMSPLSVEDNAPGIAPKMLHVVHPTSPQEWDANPLDDKADIVMAKPYFRNPPRGMAKRTPINIPGWATMTTKKMYDAGGLSHMIEDVTAHEHQGVPITVHKFSNNYSPLYVSRPKVDPLQVFQNGVMDFLTGNTDRHGGNMMVNTKETKNGYDPLLAIDHERSFLYDDKASGELHHYIDPTMMLLGPYKHHASSPHIGVPKHESIIDDSAPLRYNTENKLADWWLKNSDKIKTEFENNLTQIKNPETRDYLRANFNNRYDTFHEWASSVHSFGAENHEPLTYSTSIVKADIEPYRNFKKKKVVD